MEQELRERIKKTLLEAMANVFKMSEEELGGLMEKDLIKDLGATSLQYFPVIAALEDELDIELQYQDFRRNGKTIASVIDYVESVYCETYDD